MGDQGFVTAGRLSKFSILETAFGTQEGNSFILYVLPHNYVSSDCNRFERGEKVKKTWLHYGNYNGYAYFNKLNLLSMN